MDITTAHFKALGRLLRNNYGTSNGEYYATYATMWDVLMDALESDTIDREQFDAEYIKVVQEAAW